jgi:choline dehydrogenase-like flavoprotein
MLGRYLMDHVMTGVAGIYPGFDASFYRGRRPTGFYIPRFRNVTEPADFVRGFGYQGGAMRMGWKRAWGVGAGVGAPAKAAARKPGPWLLFVSGFGEMLPNRDNRVTLHPTKTDSWGVPQVHIECVHGENEIKIGKQISADGRAMIEAAGGTVMMDAKGKLATPGAGIHEMGTACMGHDPRTSVLNKYNQLHDVSNVFVTDGAAMSSGGCQNPSITYMALSARAAHHATEFLRAGKI